MRTVCFPGSSIVVLKIWTETDFQGDITVIFKNLLYLILLNISHCKISHQQHNNTLNTRQDLQHTPPITEWVTRFSGG